MTAVVSLAGRCPWILSLAAAGAVGLAGCHTVEGVGKDLQELGKRMSHDRDAEPRKGQTAPAGAAAQPAPAVPPSTPAAGAPRS